MTSGQYSPMTPKGAYATTAPYGNIDRNFDLCKLADAAGATYVARSTVYHVPQLIKLMEKAIDHKGFSMVEVADICPTYFGRKNKLGSPVKMMEVYDLAISIKAAEKLSKEELVGKIITGEFHNEIAPEYTEEYEKTIEKAQGDVKTQQRMEFRLSGSGGQGLILAGIILAEAAIWTVKMPCSLNLTALKLAAVLAEPR